MRDKHTTLLYRWFEEVWNHSHEPAIEELVHPEAIIHGLPTPNDQRGPAAFREFYRGFTEQYTDIRIEVEQVIADEDHEAALCQAAARHRVSGLPVSFSGICMVHLEHGQIRDAWNHFDFLTMYQQLGHHLAAPAAADHDAVGVAAN